MSLLGNFKAYGNKHASSIMAGASIAFGVIAIIEAAKGGSKASDIVREAEMRKGEPLTKKEVVKQTWKCYIPTALAGLASGGLTLKGITVANKNAALFAGAYTATEAAFKEYRESAKEVLGEKKEKEIQERVAEKQIERYPYTPDIIFGEGTLFFESLSKQYFVSDIPTIRSIASDMEISMNSTDSGDMYYTFNEWLSAIGCPKPIEDRNLGWNKGMKIRPDFVPIIKNDRQICVINYLYPPIKDCQYESWIRTS